MWNEEGVLYCCSLTSVDGVREQQYNIAYDVRN